MVVIMCVQKGRKFSERPHWMSCIQYAVVGEFRRDRFRCKCRTERIKGRQEITSSFRKVGLGKGVVDTDLKVVRGINSYLVSLKDVSVP